ncbi:hypothetical protein GF374_01840 [Candidatus Woesearchaeota archaeon]|nr:hypothetical protein [Candidatus Woesearchaeota archaeon]
MGKEYDFNEAFAEAYTELIGPKTHKRSTEAQILYIKGVKGLEQYIAQKRLQNPEIADFTESGMKLKKLLHDITNLVSRLN